MNVVKSRVSSVETTVALRHVGRLDARCFSGGRAGDGLVGGWCITTPVGSKSEADLSEAEKASDKKWTASPDGGKPHGRKRSMLLLSGALEKSPVNQFLRV